MNEETPIQIQNISKAFGKTNALNEVTLSVNNGELFGLIGLNGAGKTTLIKIMLDLLAADDGEAQFYGQQSYIPESRKNISYLPEKFHPSQFLTGEEFLSLSLSYYGKNYNHRMAQELASILELDPNIFDHKISKYSKGMGQKLGLIATLLSETPLLILDEPMSGLDPSARIQLKSLLLNYVNSGKTIFFSSHILSDIDEICNRIAVLNKGQLIYLGTPAHFKEKYGNNNLEKAFLNSIAA